METIILYLQKKCNLWFRLAAVKKLKGATLQWFILKIMIRITHGFYSFFVSLVYGGYLPYQARIGNNIVFRHSLYGIFISQNVRIEDGCIILHQVTIGSNPPKDTSAPIIRKGVFIGVGSNIIGNTIIGKYSKIGAGTTIVDADIPEYSTVVGEKYRVYK